MKKTAKTLIALTGLTITTIHIINRIQYSRATAQNVLACPQRSIYEWRFGKIHYTRQGSGSPLLLVHDLTAGSSSYEFSKITEELSSTHEVYCLDLLGYGLSDKPNMTYTNYLYVQLITDFIKNVIGKKTDIIAVGDSVPVAILACHNDQDILNRIIAINPQSLFLANQIPSRQTKLLKLFTAVPVIGTFFFNLHTTRAAFTRLFEKEYFYDSSKISEKDITAYVEASHMPNYYSRHTFASYVGKYMNANIIHALKEINHSIYIIVGEGKEDIHTTLDNYTYYNSSIETVTIPCARHLVHLERPDEVLNCIHTYLN